MSPEHLREAVGCSRELAAQYAPLLTEAAERHGIRSVFATAAWLGQIAVESGRLSRTVENLDYTAVRLAQVWPNRFREYTGRPNDLAHRLAGDPRGLGNFVYGGRMGNGPEASGDGWRYRGRGLGQITGRTNYQAVSEGIGLDVVYDPDALGLPWPAAESSAWWFRYRIPDEAVGSRDVRAISLAWNGGSNGLDERMAATRRALDALNA